MLESLVGVLFRHERIIMKDKLPDIDQLTSKLALDPRLKNVDLAALLDEANTSTPFRHVVIDGLWSESFLNEVADEIEIFDSWAGEKKFYGSFFKRYQNDWNALPLRAAELLTLLNQPTMLSIVELLMDERNLIPDPHLEGGGIHSTGQDGFLNMHTDFNWHERLQVHRRVNLLVYLNRNWNSEYGGQLELGTKDLDGNLSIANTIEPIFNRTLIFVTDENSFHGHPKPINTPAGKRRNSLATYYYRSTNCSNHPVKKRTDTNYVDRSGQKLQANVFARLRSRIKTLINT